MNKKTELQLAILLHIIDGNPGIYTNFNMGRCFPRFNELSFDLLIESLSEDNSTKEDIIYNYLYNYKIDLLTYLLDNEIIKLNI